MEHFHTRRSADLVLVQGMLSIKVPQLQFMVDLKIPRLVKNDLAASSKLWNVYLIMKRGHCKGICAVYGRDILLASVFPFIIIEGALINSKQ